MITLYEKFSLISMQSMVPKIIHYCWFSGEDFPPFIQSCIDSWKQNLPDYELKLWDANSFDFSAIPFVREAFQVKKWAFVADYIRLYALYTEGGIYLDSDVKVYKSFDSYLDFDFFTSHEIHPGNFTKEERAKLGPNCLPRDPDQHVFGLNIQAAIMGAKKGNQFVEDCLDLYNKMHFLDSEGKVKSTDFIIGPYISKVAENYGYKYNTDRQYLKDNMVIFEPELFVGNSVFLTKNSVAIHLCNGSWREQSRYEKFDFFVRNHFPSLYPLVNYWNKFWRRVNRLLEK